MEGQERPGQRGCIDRPGGLERNVFTQEIMGFDPCKKQYTRTIMTNTGDYIVLHSRGWEKEQLRWVGTQCSPGKKNRITEKITKLGESEFSVFYKRVRGKWVQAQTERLTRKIGIDQ